jgi:hypothetical protein
VLGGWRLPAGAVTSPSRALAAESALVEIPGKAKPSAVACRGFFRSQSSWEDDDQKFR